jgi:uncharacterized membrane protein YgcG
MQWKRALRHLLSTRGDLNRAFPPAALDAIERATAASERRHSGEVRFAIESALDPFDALRGLAPRARALQLFGELGVWDTEHNNGVLVYVLLADRDVEIVADRGLNGRVSAAEWTAVCGAMEAAFREGRHEAGALEGLRRIDELLAREFPAVAGARNPDELSNRPVML